MSEALTGAQHFSPVGYGESAAAHLENLAAQQAKFGTLTGRTGVNSLRALATYVRGLEPMPGVRSESLLLGALYASQQRHSPGGQFKPGTLQARMLGNVSGGTEHPQPVALLEELVVLGVKDGADALGKDREQVGVERDRITAKLKIVPALEDQIASLAAELDQTRAALSDSQSEVDELRDEVSHWRSEADAAGLERPADDGNSVTVETTGGPVLAGRTRVRHPIEDNVYVRFAPKKNSPEWSVYARGNNPKHTVCPDEESAIKTRDRFIEEGLITPSKAKAERAPKGESTDVPAQPYRSGGSLEAVLR